MYGTKRFKRSERLERSVVFNFSRTFQLTKKETNFEGGVNGVSVWSECGVSVECVERGWRVCGECVECVERGWRVCGVSAE